MFYVTNTVMRSVFEAIDKETVEFGRQSLESMEMKRKILLFERKINYVFQKFHKKLTIDVWSGFSRFCFAHNQIV